MIGTMPSSTIWRIEATDGDEAEPRTWSYVWETSDEQAARDALAEIRQSRRAIDRALVFRALRTDSYQQIESW